MRFEVSAMRLSMDMKLKLSVEKGVVSSAKVVRLSAAAASGAY